MKAEAISIIHLMTHFPMNPYCHICQAAKVQRVGHYKGAMTKGKPRPTDFGAKTTGPKKCSASAPNFFLLC